MTDEAIMHRVSNGETRLMSHLFERHQTPLYGFFYRMNRDSALSEDLVQNVFERMIKYRASYKQTVNFKSWMFSIARNVSHDHYRKQKMQFSGLETEQLNLHSDCLNTKMDAKENLNLLEIAMDRLDEETKEIILLTRVERMKYSEVAQMLNTTEGNIKVKVHRGLKQLKHLYSLTQGN